MQLTRSPTAKLHFQPKISLRCHQVVRTRISCLCNPYCTTFFPYSSQLCYQRAHPKAQQNHQSLEHTSWHHTWHNTYLFLPRYRRGIFSYPRRSVVHNNFWDLCEGTTPPVLSYKPAAYHRWDMYQWNCRGSNRDNIYLDLTHVKCQHKHGNSMDKTFRSILLLC